MNAEVEKANFRRPVRGRRGCSPQTAVYVSIYRHGRFNAVRKDPPAREDPFGHVGPHHRYITVRWHVDPGIHNELNLFILSLFLVANSVNRYEFILKVDFRIEMGDSHNLSPRDPVYFPAPQACLRVGKYTGAQVLRSRLRYENSILNIPEQTSNVQGRKEGGKERGRRILGISCPPCYSYKSAQVYENGEKATAILLPFHFPAPRILLHGRPQGSRACHALQQPEPTVPRPLGGSSARALDGTDQPLVHRGEDCQGQGGQGQTG